MGRTVRRVLVTGATGVLGRELTTRLLQAGFTVTGVSRKARSPGASSSGIRWATADLRTKTGLADAVSEVHAVIHAATSPARGSRKVDFLGTEALLREAKKADVQHVIYPSIVGIDAIPLPYYRHKLLAERAVLDSGIPFSILRATKFHPFVDSLLAAAHRPPVMLLPKNFKEQPVDAGEVAGRLVDQLTIGPGGMLAEFAGPEVLTYEVMAERWQERRRKSKRIIRIPIPGRAARRWRGGVTTNPDGRGGEVTWMQWLQQVDSA